MLNRYPLWKNLLVLFALVLGLIYSAPNLYPPDPAIQITGATSSQTVSQAVLDKAQKVLDQDQIETVGSELQTTSALIRLRHTEDQLKAKDSIERALNNNGNVNYVVALNKAPTTPGWLAAIGGEPMKLGLDLDGGVHFLLEVDIDSAVQKRMETTASEIRALLRKERNRYQSVKLNDNNEIVATFRSAELRDGANKIVGSEMPTMIRNSEDSGDSFILRVSMDPAAIEQIKKYALSQNLTALRNRVNELGVSEPLVAPQGNNRIVVELPGVQDTAAAKRIIGRTANLEFRLEAEPGALSSTKESFPMKDGGEAWLEDDIIITGDNVSDAQVGYDRQTGLPQVNITLDGAGGPRMQAATVDNVGRKMGVLFVEYKNQVTYRKTPNGEQREVKQLVDKKIISLAVIQSALGYSFRITGLDSPAEASELALLLRAGALAAPMYFVEERTIGASLGAENIQVGLESVYLGMAVVLAFMLVYYRVFGFAADVALIANIVLLVAWMSLFKATLTMPGIAGIVLTVGMAVDANVLIFSRIREELKNGMSPHQAINAGFDRAFVTILDANITTLIVAVILWAIGTGPVRGFAVTLSLGILTSMFTAIMGSRAIINFIYGGRRTLKKIWI